ncbi:MAG: UDP-4-amino-4-deoxy-L-arabinose--oxoglutarate aminotransferase [Parabacteroides sp.]
MNLFSKITHLLTVTPIWGFISPSYFLSFNQFKKAYNLISNENFDYIDEYNSKLSASLGNGYITSFASGRMAFFAILKSLDVKEGDEVVLTGFTCSVMVNAVKRCGATPVFADIDIDTLGTSPASVRRCINSSTKIIVAQHSFGIPCEIDTIMEIAKSHNIFLIEDCALSFMSSYKNILLGNWGDAAIFSTDHTKPLNTLIGGFSYTKDKVLNDKIREVHLSSGSLSKKHSYKILMQYLKECVYEKISHKLFIWALYWDFFKDNFLFKSSISPYLINDSCSVPKEDFYYPYPAKLPSFLAYIGIFVLDKYKKDLYAKHEFLDVLLSILKEYDVRIPKMYFDLSANVVPLRLCFICEDEYKLKFLRSKTDGWIWFKEPIIATVDPLDSFGYKKGMCPVAERIGSSIMNLPIPSNIKKRNLLIQKIKEYFND